MSNLLDVGFIDELHLIVHPIILGGGKAPLAGVKPQKLELLQSRAGRSGRVVLTYRCSNVEAGQSDVGTSEA